MKIKGTIDQIKQGSRIVYNDGRTGHKDVMATVLAVDGKGMTVQFEDRADKNMITFSDKEWMDFIELADCGQTMNDMIYIPPSLQAAEKYLKEALASDVETLSKPDFMKAYCSLAYLYPGFHPEGMDDWDGPTDILKIGREAWRRAEADELTDNELYPSDAQWAGLFDQMTIHTPEETERRAKLARIISAPT